MKQQVMRCGLGITDNARKGMAKFTKDEHAFFAMQDAFDIHIEKRPTNRQGNMSFSLFFDNDTNDVLAKRLEGKVAVMECVYQHDGFLATGFHVRGRKEVVRTNRRLPIRLKFQLGRNSGATMPVELYTSLRELPIAEERSEYVKKRIASWEGYLRIQERNADVADVTSAFSRASFSEDFSKLRLTCSGLKAADWRAIKGFSAKMTGASQDIGNVLNAYQSKGIVEIELNRHYKELARQNKWHLKSHKEVTFSNFAELSQVRRLRKGFKDLQDGLAANANLEKVLFEERPTVRISNKQPQLVFHNTLNKFQKEAVTGAMTSHDLYVIQGPPGTGKTTVISEICHQNVKAGLRTLVASQANLAVDNALGRLLSHQDIRILRYGRTESIEEEGKKFIEENVALNWKNQTLAAVNEQLQSHSERATQLDEDIRFCETELQDLQQELDTLAEKIILKKAAQEEQATCTKELNVLTKKLERLTVEREALISKQATLEQTAAEIATTRQYIEQQIEAQDMSAQTIAQMEQLAQQIKELQNTISYRQTLQQIQDTEHSLAAIQQAREVKQHTLDTLHAFLNELTVIVKLDELKEQLVACEIVPPIAINQQITSLERQISDIQSNQSMNAYSEWQSLTVRLSTAIANIEGLLKKHGFLYPSTQRGLNHKYTSVADIHGMIDQIGRFLIAPKTKSTLESRSYSPERYDYLEKIAIALEMLRERRSYAKGQSAAFEQQNQLLQQSKQLFTAIKTAMGEYVQQSISSLEQERTVMEQEAEQRQLDCQQHQQTSANFRALLDTVDETTALYMLQEELASKEQVYAEHQQAKATLDRSVQELEAIHSDAEETAKQLEQTISTLQAVSEESQSLQEASAKQQTVLAELADILQQKPEEERRQALHAFEAISDQLQTLAKDKERMPITHALQQQWLTLLTEANDYDLDEIRKLYVQHANVIGTTCVASARRDFMEEYPTFDVVIIDEVSKATPPELLLPMLKGKKIILVGDHHQLPPLVGQETLEEFLEEIDNQQEKKEFKQLLNESLFERLFRTLPKQNKTMLGIQYRMHESIMQTITPFYEEGNYSLQCGLTDSDAARDHLLTSRYIKRNDHLLWFDMPNKPAYFEEKVKGGTSRFNQAELTMINKLLVDLDDATNRAKQEGRMEQEAKKSVGVISYYGEQVKRIDRLLQHELMPEHLHYRTGSVDKFQGMEMDVIILSFVRNHEEKGGDIGFARDYRRLNVALSRARELLIIVGSSDMFTVRTKHQSSRDMYGRLLADIKQKNGFRAFETYGKL
ncbi:AAA domain-containing protein [Sporosarcina sp. FSL K6-1522]|uniref:DEAD/DEAH box helicase n=1 Tax=Sporosarcina sp. FSL K6-1522 TaxID=2921554 RepID=UPI00315A69A1